ncbi:MAG: hypothetical protein GQ564_08895 [Bacteroidales bacterium]|nr:hypothetical protein [Bacteroidales bacterium]
MRKVFFFVFSSFIIFALSCEKDDLTLPVQVDFEFTMDSFHSEGAKKANTFFEIDKGILNIQQIEFDGRRDQGEDYYFTSGFDFLVQAQLHNKIMSQNISYDIPQGVYNRINLNLSIGDGSEDALCLEGRFQKGSMQEVQIIFKYSFQEQIEIKAKNSIGNDQIVLSKDTQMKANIIFNVPNLFQLVNMNMIQNAEITIKDEKEVIEINKEKNIDIFNLLATRLDNSMRVVFD